MHGPLARVLAPVSRNEERRQVRPTSRRLAIRQSVFLGGSAGAVFAMVDVSYSYCGSGRAGAPIPVSRLMPSTVRHSHWGFSRALMMLSATVLRSDETVLMSPRLRDRRRCAHPTPERYHGFSPAPYLRPGRSPVGPRNRNSRGDQWRKCQRPVKTMARLCSSAAAITSASRTDPPGWATAVAPTMPSSSPRRTSRSSSSGSTTARKTTEAPVRRLRPHPGWCHRPTCRREVRTDPRPSNPRYVVDPASLRCRGWRTRRRARRRR